MTFLHGGFSRSRTWLIFGGILSLLVGVFAIAAPNLFSFVLTQLIGALCLVSGIISLFQALFGKSSQHRFFSTLSAIIRSANVVASRHKFLVALEHLLFDPDDSGKVGERDHLHKVLEHELWVFGESYHLMSTERSLTELLRNHLKLDGLPTKDVDTVRRWDGKTGRTDLHLAAKNKEHDRIRHLVVELKAPDITASRKELDQVEDYANAILSTAAFTGDRTSWDLILVVTDYDDLVRRRIKGDDFELGLFFEPQKEQGRPLVRAYVRRWRDVIDENKRRLEFMTNALEHDPSITEGLQYVRSEYEDLLPEELRAVTATAN